MYNGNTHMQCILPKYSVTYLHMHIHTLTHIYQNAGYIVHQLYAWYDVGTSA